MGKAPRFKRKPEAIGSLRIQPRDMEIIKLAHDYRFLDSGQMQALVGGSNQVILRRLQKLFHHGYLDRPVSQIVFSNPLMGHQNIVYGLGDKGADLLAERLGIDRGKIIWQEKNKEAGERYIQHTLMISNFRTCLTMALGDQSSVDSAKLLFWKRENPQELKFYAYLKEDGRQRRLPIVPDGFFSVEDSRGMMYFFLEADRSTMTNSRFLNKMRAYWLWFRAGGSRKLGLEQFRVLTITRTKERRDNLAKVIQKEYGGQAGYMFWFATEGHFNLSEPQTVLQDIWQTAEARDTRRHCLLETG